MAEDDSVGVDSLVGGRKEGFHDGLKVLRTSCETVILEGPEKVNVHASGSLEANILLKYGLIPASFSFIFVLFSFQNQLQFQCQQYNLKKHRWCAWGLNPGRRRIQTTELWRPPLEYSMFVNYNC